MGRRPVRRNPLARIVRAMRPKVVKAKKGKGSYRRKKRAARPERAGSGEEKAEE